MTRYTVRFHAPLEVIVDIDADDEDEAADRAWQEADEYVATINGDYRKVRAYVSLDGIGADDVEAAR